MRYFALILVAIATASLSWATNAYGAPKWTIDTAKSRLIFSGTHAGNAFQGTFEKWSAEIAFDPDDLAGSTAQVSVQTGSAKTGNMLYDGTMSQAEWLDSKSVSEAKFKSTGFSSTGPQTFKLTGDLTLKAKTVPVTLIFTLALDGKVALVKGSTLLDRATFDIGQKSDAKAEWVSKDIKLEIDLRATRAN
jgi:cytochrome b561